MGSPHTNIIVITAEIESGFVAKGDLVPFGTTPNGGFDGWASRAAHVMGAAIPNVLQPGAFTWFEKTQGEGATCTWMAAVEAVGCTRAFLTTGLPRAS
ncbi:uncharacterized protein TNCV_4054921 [Trichonephila clavipes]|nr:uncharacterized protein TNCV_4054921 [Trichonephila clavipes]